MIVIRSTWFAQLAYSNLAEKTLLSPLSLLSIHNNIHRLRELALPGRLNQISYASSMLCMRVAINLTRSLVFTFRCIISIKRPTVFTIMKKLETGGKMS